MNSRNSFWVRTCCPSGPRALAMYWGILEEEEEEDDIAGAWRDIFEGLKMDAVLEE